MSERRKHLASVHITCKDRPFDHYFRVAEEGASIKEAYSGWEQIDRPGRTAVPNWTGRPLIELEIPVWYGLVIDNEDLTPAMEGLRRLTGRASEGGIPPVVSVTAPHGLIPWVYPYGEGGQEWVITNISETGKYFRNVAGSPMLVQCEGVISIMQHIEDDSFSSQLKTLRKKVKTAAARSHTVKKGQTLTAIAKQHYGVANDTNRDRIRKGNAKVKNWSKLKTGQKLVIPAKK